MAQNQVEGSINKISQISNILNQNNLINNNKFNNNLNQQRNTLATNYLPNELSLNNSKLTDKKIAEIDTILDNKEKDIMSV